MFPNEVMTKPQDLERHPGGDDRGARRARLGRMRSRPASGRSRVISTRRISLELHMSAKKPLNIGLVGYGFMGRTHSNAYKRVNDFFDVAYRPVLKAVCGRTADGAKAFAEQLGLRVDRDRLAEAGRAQGYRRDRHLHAQQHARRDRHRRGRGRQDDPLREAAVDEPGRGPEDGRRRSRRPACPTRSGTTTAACRP